MAVATGAICFLSNVFRDCLPAAVSREGKINDRPFGHLLAVWHQSYVVPWASSLRCHAKVSPDLRRNDPMESLVAFLSSPFLWLIRIVDILRTNADGLPLAILFGIPQNLFKLSMGLFTKMGGVLLWSMGKVDGRLRLGIGLDPPQLLDEQPDGLAVFAVVLDEVSLILLILRRLPLVPPNEALQSRSFGTRPSRAQETAQNLEAV